MEKSMRLEVEHGVKSPLRVAMAILLMMIVTTVMTGCGVGAEEEVQAASEDATGGADACQNVPNGDYCSDGFGLIEGDLLQCVDDRLVSRTPCAYGCNPQPYGTNDRCFSRAELMNLVCENRSDGSFCASTAPEYAGSADLIYCEGGKLAGEEECTSKCAPQMPGLNDFCVDDSQQQEPCAGLPTGDYCSETLGLLQGSLVTCEAGRMTFNEFCGTCRVNGSNVNDTCEEVVSQTACSGTADGMVCASDLGNLILYSGEESDVVECFHGEVYSFSACPYGCLNAHCEEPVSQTCAGKSNGTYCGSDLSNHSGDPNSVVSCFEGSVIAESTPCDVGCVNGVCTTGPVEPTCRVVRTYPIAANSFTDGCDVGAYHIWMANCDDPIGNQVTCRVSKCPNGGGPSSSIRWWWVTGVKPPTATPGNPNSNNYCIRDAGTSCDSLSCCRSTGPWPSGQSELEFTTNIFPDPSYVNPSRNHEAKDMYFQSSGGDSALAFWWTMARAVSFEIVCE